MSNLIRAWKDETYRQGLSTQEQAMLPVNPAGAIELTEAELEAISGALGSSGKGIVWEPEEVDGQVEQKISATTQLGTAPVFTPAAPVCNNTESPAIAKPTLLDL
jgi:mersacidin/lichenicidin family type 2 lantibiotic